MNKRWIFLTNHYEGIEKYAVNLLYAEIAEHLDYVLPIKTTHSVTETELANSNVIIVGKPEENEILAECQKEKLIKLPQKSEGYAVFVGESIFSAENQMIIISGFDEAGVLYGCMDFCNRYIGDVIYCEKDLWQDRTYEDLFNNKLNYWEISSAPAIKRRAIWTWGHVIYDYRKFFENMARLRLNEIVIWNDVAPINAKDIVAYAHRYHIKVIWGFAWGWDTENKEVLEHYDENARHQIKQKVLDLFETQYAEIAADGIYFQSFTELNDEMIDGKCIAQEVTALVNDIAGSLLDLHPDLHIQFGLHATSVKNKLEFIQKVDPRIYLVWENCGSFPFDYYTDRVDTFDETHAFIKKTLTLRGEEENWGAVLKGMLKLDWRKFEHFSGPFLLGESTNRYIRRRQPQKDRIWKLQQAGWLKNADYVRRIIELVEKEGREDAVVEALVEDAMLENKIAFPAALYAEMLWSPEGDIGEMIERVSKYPCVYYSNI